MQTTVHHQTEHHQGEDAYEDYLGRVRRRFANLTEPLFTTNADGLFPAFLDALPPGRRQEPVTT